MGKFLSKQGSLETASVSGGAVTGELDRLHTPPGYSSDREWLEGLIVGMRSHDWTRSDSVRWLCISVRRDSLEMWQNSKHLSMPPFTEDIPYGNGRYRQY